MGSFYVRPHWRTAKLNGLIEEIATRKSGRIRQKTMFCGSDHGVFAYQSNMGYDFGFGRVSWKSKPSTIIFDLLADLRIS
jgi:hypothetical protein